MAPMWEARRFRDERLCTLVTRPAPLLCLQLLRFHNEVGDVQRDIRTLQGHLTTIHVPVFKDECEAERSELQCIQIPYQVVSMVLHYGASPTERHYQAILCGQY